MAVVVAKSSQEFADFVQNAISSIPGILRTETFVNLNIYKGQAVTLDDLPPKKESSFNISLEGQ